MAVVSENRVGEWLTAKLHTWRTTLSGRLLVEFEIQRQGAKSWVTTTMPLNLLPGSDLYLLIVACGKNPDLYLSSTSIDFSSFAGAALLVKVVRAEGVDRVIGFRKKR